ncbi:hypothetical protein XENOCAPTIV_025729 [Xenoophorus captivus]|uniref:Uncharacterized protein n=1 Tax=Xenoophorus captivus TaxID=1517983 RepID=A0ABV0RNA6_9TELE
MPQQAICESSSCRGLIPCFGLVMNRTMSFSGCGVKNFACKSYKLNYVYVDSNYLCFCSSLHIVAPPFTSRDTLKAWQEKNHPWLELSDVHRETTENIRVTVIPFYMGMRVGVVECVAIIQCWSTAGPRQVLLCLCCIGVCLLKL